MEQEDGFALKTFFFSLSLLIAFFLGITWWVRGGFDNEAPQSQLSAQAESLSLAKAPVKAAEPTPGISWGNKILITNSTNRHKLEGADAIAKRDYAAAIKALETARNTDLSDPETLIYLNNARLGNADAFAIAAAVPAETAPEIANSILRGIAQAQTEINQSGGIQGKPLRIAIADDKDSSVFAKAIATELIQTPEILGVIGHNSTPAAAAAAEIYNNQLLALLPTNTAIDPATLNQYTHPTISSDPLVAGAMAFYIFELDHSSAAIFYDSRSDHSRTLKSHFETALSANGGAIVGQMNLADTAARQDNNIARMETAPVSVVFPSTNALVTTLKQVNSLTQSASTNKHLFGSYELFSPAILDQIGNAANGTIIAIPNEIYASAASPFGNSASTLWGQAVDWRTTTSYNATQSMIAGLRQTPTRQGLKQIVTAENNALPRGVRLLKIEIQAGAETRYKLISLGFLAKEDIFVPE